MWALPHDPYCPGCASSCLGALWLPLSGGVTDIIPPTSPKCKRRWTDALARDYSHHVDSKWRQVGDRIIWEIAIDIYDDRYTDDGENNVPVALHAGKQMGLMLAYCDNDGSELRENFVGSESVPTGPKDRGWIDAGLFGTLELSDGE